MALPAFLLITIVSALGCGLFVGRAEAFRGKPILGAVVCLICGAFCGFLWIQSAVFFATMPVGGE